MYTVQPLLKDTPEIRTLYKAERLEGYLGMRLFQSF